MSGSVVSGVPSAVLVALISVAVVFVGMDLTVVVELKMAPGSSGMSSSLSHVVVPVVTPIDISLPPRVLLHQHVWWWEEYLKVESAQLK